MSIPMSDRQVPVVASPFRATITPPGSKSLTNRALVLAAMADGRCTLRNVLFADDTQVMIDCLTRLGFGLEVDRATHTIRVAGRRRRDPRAVGGTVLRQQRDDDPISRRRCARWAAGRTSSTASPACGSGRSAELVEMLKNLGVRIEYAMKPRDSRRSRCSPTDCRAGSCGTGRSKSSQFLSAVLMAAPYARHEVQVELWASRRAGLTWR